MKKRWNVIGKMTICTLTAAMVVMIGTGYKMTARAEMLTGGEEEILTMEETQETEAMEALPEEEMQETEAQETEEPKVDVTEYVVIEENEIPGAAQPELESSEEGEEQAEEEEAEGAVQEEGDVPEEGQPAEEAPEEEASETCVSGTIAYEDSEVAVTVVVSEEAKLPANTEVKVTKLAEGSAEYESAKEAARQSVGAGENATYTFYGVTLESEGQELEVEEGTVSIRMEFKTDAEKKEVVKIEETESGKVARNITDRIASQGKVSSIELAY